MQMQMGEIQTVYDLGCSNVNFWYKFWPDFGPPRPFWPNPTLILFSTTNITPTPFRKNNGSTQKSRQRPPKVRWKSEAAIQISSSKAGRLVDCRVRFSCLELCCPWVTTTAEVTRWTVEWNVYTDLYTLTSTHKKKRLSKYQFIQP